MLIEVNVGAEAAKSGMAFDSPDLEPLLEAAPRLDALTFRGLTFPWSFYADAIAALDSSLAGHPRAGRIGIVLRNRPGPLAALIATIGTGRAVVTLSPHLGDAGLAQDIIDLALNGIRPARCRDICTDLLLSNSDDDGSDGLACNPAGDVCADL